MRQETNKTSKTNQLFTPPLSEELEKTPPACSLLSRASRPNRRRGQHLCRNPIPEPRIPRPESLTPHPEVLERKSELKVHLPVRRLTGERPLGKRIRFAEQR